MGVSHPKNSRATPEYCFQIYSLCKLSALAYTITNLVGYNVTESINCDAWLTSRYVRSSTGDHTTRSDTSIGIRHTLHHVCQYNCGLAHVSAETLIRRLRAHTAG